MRHGAISPTVVIAALALSPVRAPLSAQAAATLDAAATRISYADTPGATGFALAPGIQVVRPWQSLVAAGSWSRFRDGIWSLQGQVAGSAYLAPVAGLRPELDARGSGTRHQDGDGSGEFAGAMRLHWLGTPHGMWFGGGAGRAWNGTLWQTNLAAEAGGWVRRGPGILAASISASRVGAELRYGDLEGAFRLDRGALELAAWGGLRQWFRPDGAAGGGWAGASAAWWIGERMAVTAGAGSYAADYAQGLPEGTFGTLGLRVATGRITRARRVNERLDLLILPPARSGGAALVWEDLGGGSIALTLRGVVASSVDIMGDFTAWEPVSLAQTGADRWRVTLPIRPGLYRMNFRTDGGPWQVPPGMASAHDEFGGEAGILVVQQGFSERM